MAYGTPALALWHRALSHVALWHMALWHMALWHVPEATPGSGGGPAAASAARGPAQDAGRSREQPLLFLGRFHDRDPDEGALTGGWSAFDAAIALCGPWDKNVPAKPVKPCFHFICLGNGGVGCNGFAAGRAARRLA